MCDLPTNRLSAANSADSRQMCPNKATSTEVWTQFNNGGDWPTMALSVFVGLIGSVFANNGKRYLSPNIERQSTIDTVFSLGTDCAVHVSSLAPYIA